MKKKRKGKSFLFHKPKECVPLTPPSSTCGMNERDKPTLSSRIESSPTLGNLTRSFWKRHVWTMSSIPFGKLLVGKVLSRFRRSVLGLLPSNFYALFKRMHSVFYFDFMEFHIGFHGRILVAPSVLIVVVLFLLSMLVVILLMSVFCKNFLVGLFAAS
jgi:hypothetical protein